MTPCFAVLLFVLCCASLCADLRESLIGARVREQVGRSVAGSIEERTTSSAPQEPSCGFAVKTFFFLLFGRAAGFRNLGVGGEGRGARLLY